MATNLGVPIGDELRRSTENLHDVLSATGEIVEVGTTFVDENDAEASDSSSDLDLEFSPGLDEDEFDLPTLDTIPTLESILAEGSDEEDALKDILPGGGKLKEDAAAFDSRRKTLMPAPNKLSENVHGSVLKAVSLPNIGAQLDRTKAQLDSGFPTALAAGKVIAIGTSRGLVLVFEAKALKWVLGDAMHGSQYGAISAMGFNTDSTRLICGYARGQLTMWDVVAGKLLRTITDAHPPGHAVLQVEFTDNLTCALFSDSMGSVYMMNFKRKMGIRSTESSCLFTGSRGEVCCMEPLHMGFMQSRHPLNHYSLVALATFSKVMLVSISPSLSVLYSHPLTGDPDSLPIVGWHFVFIQTDEGKIFEPVLSFARSNVVHFSQVSCDEEKQIFISQLKTLKVPYKIAAMKWMTFQIIILLDTTEIVHVVDVKSGDQLGTLDIGYVELVYSTSFFKSLATGGNVSRALAVASQHACGQSFISWNGEVILLGIKNVHVVTLRSWKERLDVLVSENRFLDALALGVAFYRGTAKAVVGVTGSQTEFREAVSYTTLDNLAAYLEFALALMPDMPTKGEQYEFFAELVTVCADYCIVLDRTDVLFGDLYERFCENSVSKAAFLHRLEPYILSDKLTSLSPFVLKDFVEHYQNKKKLDSVEKCLLHLDVRNLDIHQVVILCWTHSLYDAMIYIYNWGLNDYVTPLEELLRLLRHGMKSKKLSQADQNTGYKVFVYLNYCFSGAGYPTGTLPKDKVLYVKSEVYNSLVTRHTKDALDDEPTYPNLRTLLAFDSKEFFNVLSLAFDEEEFDDTRSDGLSRQKVINILSALIISNPKAEPGSLEVVGFCVFLARQVAKHGNQLEIQPRMFDRMMACVTESMNDSSHEERQQAFLDLLNAGVFERGSMATEYNEDKLLLLSENARFYRVLHVLYERSRQLAKIVSCYMRDPLRKMEAFRFIHEVMSSDDYVEFEREEVERAALDSLQDLVAIDSEATARLILADFAHDIVEVVQRLQSHQTVLYEFLQGVFDSRAGYSVSKSDSPPPADVHEQYIELMCIYHPNAVFGYLRRCDAYYRLEQTLAICDKYRVTDAQAFLLEKTGAVQEAFDLMLDALQQHISRVVDAYSKGLEPTPTLKTTRATLAVIIQLCQRNSSRLKEKEREALWFPLLDAVMAPSRELKDQDDIGQKEVYKGLTSEVLNSLIGHVSLSSVLQRILQDPTYQGGRLEEVKDLIMDMIDTYNYERTLLATTNNLLAKDVYSSMTTFISAANRGRRSKPRMSAADRQISSGMNLRQVQSAAKLFKSFETDVKLSSGQAANSDSSVLKDSKFALKLAPSIW